MKTRVLLVEDDPEIVNIANILIRQKEPELEIVISRTVKDALEKIKQEKFDIVISEYLMPDSTGLDLLEALRNEGAETSFIIWTGHSREEIVIRALNLGADYYILKDTNITEQLITIDEIIKSIISNKTKEPRKFIEQKRASEFIHKLSHDLTGITHNIMGYATLIEEEFDKSYVEGIRRLASKLTARVKTAVSDVDSGELNEL